MKVIIASTLRERIRGLKALGNTSETLMLIPCCDIHTLGMSTPIDVAFVSRKGEVLLAYRKVPPNRRLKCSGARAVLERFSIDSPWVTAGEFIEMESRLPLDLAK